MIDEFRTQSHLRYYIRDVGDRTLAAPTLSALADRYIVNLGHRLKLFRVAAGLKQGEVAKKLKVANNHVYMVESGRREPSLDYVEKFSKAVKVPMAVFFLESDPTDEKSRKITENIMALLAEYSEVTEVKKRRA